MTMIGKTGMMMKMKMTTGTMPGTTKKMRTMKATMTTMTKTMTMTVTAVAVSVSITGQIMTTTGQAVEGGTKVITTGRPQTAMMTADQEIRGTEGITVPATETIATILHPVGRAVEADPLTDDPHPAVGETVPVVRAVPDIQDPAPAETVQVDSVGMRRDIL